MLAYLFFRRSRDLTQIRQQPLNLCVLARKETRFVKRRRVIRKNQNWIAAKPSLLEIGFSTHAPFYWKTGGAVELWGAPSVLDGLRSDLYIQRYG